MIKDKADLIEVCDAMAEAMNSGDFSVDFESVRAYLPTIELETLDELRVVTVPVAHSSERVTRDRVMRGFEVHIGVQKKLEEINNVEIDPLMLLMDDLQTFFEDEANRTLTISGGRQAHVMSFINDESDPAYSQDHLKAFRQFTSVLRAEVRVY